jgi:hypothetical protein
MPVAQHVAAEFAPQDSLGGTAADHLIGIDAVWRSVGQHPTRPNAGHPRMPALRASIPHRSLVRHPAEVQRLFNMRKLCQSVLS